MKELYQDFDELLDESLDGCLRVTAIVKNLKDFSNVDSADKTPCNINKLIETVHELVQNQLPENMNVVLKLGKVPDLKVNGGHLSQVFYNLMSNAIDAISGSAMERPGKVSFSTSEEHTKLIIKVSDNGPGMEADVLKNIFVPFYTTKDVGSGIGLGLSVCRDILVAHGGDISVHSVKGVGSQFIINLPLDNDL